MADGSVRFIKEAVQSWMINQVNGVPEGPDGGNTPPRGVCQVLGSRNGGEIISADSY